MRWSLDLIGDRRSYPENAQDGFQQDSVSVFMCGFLGKTLGSMWFPLSSSYHVSGGLIGAGSPSGGCSALTSGSFNTTLP